MEEINNWTAKGENKFKATLEDAKFIYDQSEKKLKEIVSSGDLVVSRTTTLITVIVAVLVALVGFSINRYLTLRSFDNFIISSIIVISYLLTILWYNSLNILGTKYSVIGASPKTLFSDDFFVTENSDLRSKMLIWAQIENYQDSIRRNDIKNKKRWNRLNISIILVSLIPIVLIFSFFILQYFS